MSGPPDPTLGALGTLRQTRRALVAVVDALPDAARTAVPDGFRNHVLWNAGHLAATEQLLSFGLAGRDLDLPHGFVEDFRKGSSPLDWRREWAWDEVRGLLLALPDRTEAAYRDGQLGAFARPYRTTPGVVLATVEDAARFNLYHEGLHLGTVLALRKLVGPRVAGA